MVDVERLKPRVAELCRQVKASRLDLFGAVVTGKPNRRDDVDVLVRFERNGGELFNRFFDLKEGLEEIFGRSVDVFMEETLRDPDLWEGIERSRPWV